MIETVGRVVDVGGVTIIVVGVTVATLTALARLVRRDLNTYDTSVAGSVGPSCCSGGP